MQFDVDARTIYLTIHGSQAYGLNTKDSDVDIKGMCIEPKEYFLGYLNNFEQQEKLARKGNEADSVIYSIRKFFKLAADCNPNIIEVLFVDESDILKIDKYGEKVRENRDLFLSKKALHTFSGYAYAQLKRIKTHRRWLLSPPTHKPTRQEFGLQEQPVIPKNQISAVQALITKKLDQWNFKDMEHIDPATRIMIIENVAEFITEMKISNDSLWENAARTLGLNENFIQIVEKEKQYKQAIDEWNHYNEWVTKRNPARAEGEKKFGYDLKHASHCVRLMRMCEEILSGKGVIVKRPDREELLGIKLHGIWTYDKLMEETEVLMEKCRKLYVENDSLPKEPQRTKLNSILIEIVEGYLAENM